MQLLTLGQDMVGELVSIVLENIKKSMAAMNLKNLITELTVSYLNSYAVHFNFNFRVMSTRSCTKPFWMKAGKASRFLSSFLTY